MSLSDEFKIKLGVEIDNDSASRVQSQIDTALRNTSVKVDLDTSLLTSHSKQAMDILSQLNKTQVKLRNIDTSGLTQSIKDSKQLFEKELTNLKINISEKDKIKLLDENDIENARKLVSSVKLIETSARSLRSEADKLSVSFALDKNKSLSVVGKYLKDNTKAAKDYGYALEEVKRKMMGATDITSLKSANKEFQAITKQIQAAGKNGRSFSDEISNDVKKFATWISASTIVMQGINQLRLAVGNIKELDTQLVDLKKTTSATSDELLQFYYTANDTAKLLGVTTANVIEATSAYSRLGYAIGEAQELAKNSAIFKAISPEMSLEQGISSLTSIIKGFDIEANKSLDSVVSKVNVLGNKFATSNTDIAEALKRSSAAMSAANNTFEETAALATGAIEIVQDASSVGTALKTISMRIRALDEETGGYDKTLETLKGKVFDLSGISVMSDPDTYKSTFKVLQDISGVFDDLTDKQRAGVLEELFGKRQANIGSAILKNWSQVEKAMKEMENADGGAMEEMAIIYDSLDFKLNRLKETMTGISQNVFDSGTFKVLVDSLTNILSLIDKITSASGGLGVAFGALGAYAGAKGLGVVNVNNENGNIQNPFAQNASVLKQASEQISRFQKEQIKADFSQQKFADNMSGSVNPAIKQYFQNTEMASVSQQGLTNYLKQAGAAFDATAIKATAMNVALNMGIGILIGAGINLAFQAIDALVTTEAELEEQAQRSRQTYEETVSSLENINKELDENDQKIKSIKSKGKLTYTDKSEIEKLQDANEKLETQLKLKEKLLTGEAKDAAEDAGKTLDKYEKTPVSRYGNPYIDLELSDENNQEDLALPEDLDSQLKIYKKYNDILKDVNASKEDLERANDKVASSESNLAKGLDDIQSTLGVMKEGYDSLAGKSESSFTKQDKYIEQRYEKFKSIYDEMTYILDPNAYNQIKIDKIFDTDGIELTKDELIQLAKDGSLENLDLTQYKNLEQAIKNSVLRVEEGKNELQSFKSQVEALNENGHFDLDINGLTDGLEDSIDLFDQWQSGMTNLADLTDALGSSFTLTAEQARAFADVYPELLAMGQVTNDGLIKFNEAQVNDFINGRQAELEADTGTRISQLEAAKAVLTGSKDKAEAELQLALGVANGEIDIEQAKVQSLSEAKRLLTQYLIDLGVDEVEANKAVAMAESNNMQEYEKIVGQTAFNNTKNLASSMGSAASATKANMTNMVDSVDDLNREVVKTSQNIAAMAAGKATYKGKTVVGGGSAGNFTATINTSKGTFQGYDGKELKAAQIQMDNWVKDIQLDISSYTSAIASIDTQINLLKAGMNTNLDKYSSGKYKSKDTKKKNTSSKKEFEKVYDWLSTAIEELEDKVKKLGNTSDNVYKDWSVRNTALAEQMTSLVDQLQLQQAAYNVYSAQANSVGLSDNYKNLVRNGALDIETITDENLSKKIDEYQTWYKKSQEVLDSIQDIEESISKVSKQKFDNVISIYEDKISVIESQVNNINTLVDMAEARGAFASKSYYDTLLKFNDENISNLTKERDELIKALNTSVQDETIAKGSETWYAMKKSIDDVNSSLLDAQKNVLDLNNELRELNWQVFDFIQERISNVTTETEFLIGLFENKKLFGDNGKQTENADALFALYGINYNTFMSQADDYAKELKKLDGQYANDSLNKDYLERRRELLKLQQESITNAESQKQSIIDLKEQGYEALLDSLQEIIDKYNDLRKAEKDLYDYQKEIASKTDNISSIEKRLSAYKNDDSEETQKTVQELKVELQKAKEDLEETEYDKYLSDQEALLDSLYGEFEEWISVRLDDVDRLISETIDSINQNSDKISETLKETTGNLGYELSESMKTIFSKNGEIGTILSTYDANFLNRMTSLQSAIDIIKQSVNTMVANSNKKAEEELKKQQAEQNKVTNPPAKPPATSSSGNNNSGSSSGSSGSSGSSSSNKKNIFVYKKGNYPKGKLNRYGSIVDGLKYYDYDSSYSIRKSYYSQLGGSGNYTGSASQNNWLLKQFRSIQGYSSGGFVGGLQSIIKKNGDDSLSINTLKKGEAILDTNTAREWKVFQSHLSDLNKIINMLNNSDKSNNSQLNFGDLNFDFDMSGVNNYDEFRTRFMEDKNMQLYVLTLISDAMSGKKITNTRRFK